MKKLDKSENYRSEIDVHKKILEEAINQKDEGPSRWNKYFVAAISIFLLIILIVYIVPGETFDAVQGILMSNNLENNKIIKGDITIIFDENALKELQNHYLNNQKREIKACLYGEIKNGTRYINKIEFPNIYFASVIKIVSSGCNSDVLIDLHSHPINRCIASDQDLSNLKNEKRSNPNILMAIMCNEKRFAIYS